MRIFEFTKRKRRPEALDLVDVAQAESLIELNQRSLILFNQFSRRMDRLNEYLSAELPAMVAAYEQWRAISDQCEEMSASVDPKLCEDSRNAIKLIDETMKFWNDVANGILKKRKAVNE